VVLKFSRKAARLLQLAVHLGALLPLAWLTTGAITERLGGDPVETIIHFLGKGALHLLLLSLCVTPLAKGLGAGNLMRLRRPLGLWCFAYASLHFGAWLSLDLRFAWGLVIEEIIKRGYLLVGFTAWLILLALAITSLPKLMKRLGARWKKLHQWVYAVALLVLVHYIWSVKGGWAEPAVYLCITLLLLSLRYRKLLRDVQTLGYRSVFSIKMLSGSGS
jgi:sulfoxide reductase heme-binding subunit YedZ